MLSAQTPVVKTGQRGDDVDARKLIRQLNDSSTFKFGAEWQTPAQSAKARRRQLYEEEQRAAKMRFDEQEAIIAADERGMVRRSSPRKTSPFRPRRPTPEARRPTPEKILQRRRDILNIQTSSNVINRSPDQPKRKSLRIPDNPAPYQTESGLPEPTRTSTEAKHDQPRPSPRHRMNEILDEVTALMEERCQLEELEQQEQMEVSEDEQPPQDIEQQPMQQQRQPKLQFPSHAASALQVSVPGAL